MKWSKAYIPTLKEDPSDAEVASHKLMVRAGFMRRLGSGTYSYLPLGLKILRKIENIVRTEMNAVGALEVLLPAIQPIDIWKKTERLELLKEILITYKDRSGKTNIFGPTHEEVITDLAAKDLRSYRDLPFILYQIQTKFRDEPRPRFGVLRSREFIMKDAYSFDIDKKALDANYKSMHKAYCNIFKRCGIDYIAVEADSGFMGGDVSHEFMAPAKCGEDKIVLCKACKFSASADKVEGDSCPKCKKKLESKLTIELGHIFKLGTKYSKALDANYLDEKGATQQVVMGCYGIGINRILAAAIEQGNDKDGIIWPGSIAPYQVVIIEVDPTDKSITKEAESLYKELKESGVDVLLDDRDERPGIKFKDADLIGFPIHVIIGKKGLAQGNIEIKLRKTQKKTLHPVKQALTAIKSHLNK